MLTRAAAAESHPLEFVKFLVEKGADLNRNAGEFDAPAVTYAARSGNLDIAEFLVDTGAAIDISDELRNSLMLPAEEGHLDVVRYLLTIDIDPHATYLRPGGVLVNALTEAENNRHKEVAELLKAHGCRRPIKGVDIPIRDPDVEDEEDLLDQDPMVSRYRQIVEYMEDRFRPVDVNGMQELLPPIEGMSVTINVIQPNDEHPFLVFFTNGMDERIVSQFFILNQMRQCF